MAAIERVCVIGAGVMGAGIAAHVTNAGVPVLLLDRVPDGGGDRDAIAKGAVEKMIKADPAPFMHKANAKLITPGNVDDHIGQVSDCDWIIEAVAENLEIKQTLYRKIEAARKPGSIVSSNTSTIPLAQLTEGIGERFARDFLIAHFFNPPRYMRLLELVAGPDTSAEAEAAVRDFADVRLGKGVVKCKDTPGFIANRIGTFWLQCAVVEAMDGGLSIEEADAALGRPMGFPKTGVFALLDLVGLDLMPHILESLGRTLPAGDGFHAINRDPELIRAMVADGYTGRKGKGGFYRLNTDSGERVKEAMDLKTRAYQTAAKPKLESVAAARKGGPRALLEHPDRGGRYAWRVMSRTLAYAASLVPEIADDITAVDEAMRLGYNWKFGPFELMDEIGPAWFAERLEADGQAVPDLLAAARSKSFYQTEGGRLQFLGVGGSYGDVIRPRGVLLLSDIKAASRPLARNWAASLWDAGDGVCCLEFHSKMNSIGPGIMAMIWKSLKIVGRDHKALVIYNEGSNFSVGANLGLVVVPAMVRAWFLIDLLIWAGQKTFMALKRAPFPVVAAPSGLALGGGCEILLHSDAVQAHAETYTGLVETAVGIVPAWGGCKELLLRWDAKDGRPGGPMVPVTKAFEMLSMASVAKSAHQARDFLILRPNDGITMNRDRLLADAKARALSLVDGYAPPEPGEISLPGPSAKVALEMAVHGFRKRGLATPHDEVVAGVLAGVLSGGATDVTETLGEDALLALERRAIAKLVRTPATTARVKHMLKTGKPLRN
jgi:3-hydroxyacyl-CoA dehydrogenase